MGKFCLHESLTAGKNPSDQEGYVSCHPPLHQTISCSLKIIKILQAPRGLFWSMNEVTLDSYNWSLTSFPPLKLKTLPFIGMELGKSPKIVKTWYFYEVSVSVCQKFWLQFSSEWCKKQYSKVIEVSN